MTRCKRNGQAPRVALCPGHIGAVAPLITHAPCNVLFACVHIPLPVMTGYTGRVLKVNTLRGVIEPLAYSTIFIRQRHREAKPQLPLWCALREYS